MSVRSVLRALIALPVALVLLTTGAIAYGPPPPYLVKLSGPSRAVDCGDTVTITATVVNTDNGKPVKSQIVRWSLAESAPSDSFSSTRTVTDAKGRASTQLTIGQAPGDRRVIGDARSIRGRLTVKVRCVLPTPAPTPRPTQRPQQTPRPQSTPRPQATPKPTARPTEQPAASPSASVTDLERPDLVVGIRENDLQGRAPFLLADAYGLWAEAGLSSVTQTPVDDPIGGLLDGTLDVAVVPLDAAIAAIADGQPLVILSGYHSYRSDIVAVAADVASVSDLAGKPVILGDDARARARLALLGEAGWEPIAAGADETLPDGGMPAWVKAFLDGDVAMTPMRNEDRLVVGQADATLVVDAQSYGDDVLVTTRQRLDDAPRSMVAFLSGTLAGLRELADPASDADLFAAAGAAGIPMGAGIEGGWVNDVDDFRPWDGSLGDPAIGDGLGEFDAFARAQLGWVPLPADVVALDALHAAQEALGMAAAPVLPALPAPASGAIAIALPSDELADRAPLVLAQADDAFAAAGLTDVTVTATDGLAGVLDGSLDLAVVTASDAAAAGDAIEVVAGYQPAASSPTVLIAKAGRDPGDLAPAVQALLRGMAALHAPDALARATDGAPTPDDEAAWPSIVAAFAPDDGSTAEPADPIHPALAAARASLGLVGDQAD